MDTSFYDVLELPKTATVHDIKKQFKKLAVKYHPDKLKDEEKEAGTIKFKELNEAYSVLSDPEKKQLYDKFGKEAVNGSGGPGFGHNMDDIMETLFKRQTKRDAVPPIKLVVNISLEELYKGKKCKETFDRYSLCTECNSTGFKDKSSHSCNKCSGRGAVMQVVQIGPGMVQQTQRQCPECKGSGSDNKNHDKCIKCEGKRVVLEKHTVEFQVPPGSINEDVIFIKNEGNEIPHEAASQSKYERGKVAAIIHEVEHELFKRGGVVIDNKVNPANLIIEFKITLVEALCGFRREFTYLDGKKFYIEEIDVISDGAVRVITDRGLPYKTNEYKYGDLYIKYNIDYPDTLTDEQKSGIYKLLTGKDKDQEYANNKPSYEYTHIETHSVDSHNHNNAAESDDEDDERQHGAPVNCQTQ